MISWICCIGMELDRFWFGSTQCSQWVKIVGSIFIPRVILGSVDILVSGLILVSCQDTRLESRIG